MTQTESYRDRNSGRIGNYAEDFARFFPQLERVGVEASTPEEIDGETDGNEKASATAPTAQRKGATGADKES